MRKLLVILVVLVILNACSNGLSRQPTTPAVYRFTGEEKVTREPQEATRWARLGSSGLKTREAAQKTREARDQGESGSYGTSSNSGKYKVEYRVTGSAKRASLTYQNETGNSEQRTVGPFVYVPWTRSYSMKLGDFVYISAQNRGENGTIKCEILYNGRVVESAESRGAYAIATCSGAVGRE